MTQHRPKCYIVSSFWSRIVVLFDRRAKKPLMVTFLKLIDNILILISTYSEMIDYSRMFSDISVIEMCTSYCLVTYYFKVSPGTDCVWHVLQLLNRKLTFRGRVLKSQHVWHFYISIRLDKMAMFCKFFGVKKLNDLVPTYDKLTDNFASLFTSGLESDAIRGPPVGVRCRPKG